MSAFHGDPCGQSEATCAYAAEALTPGEAAAAA